MVVTTRFNTEVLVRNGEMGDQNGVIYFALWLNKTSVHLQEGDCVKFQNCTLSTKDHMWKSETN